MGPVKIHDDNIISVIVAGSAAFLVLLVVIGLIGISGKFALGVLAGGIIALGNFFWLASALKRVLQLPVHAAGRYAQLRYLARLTVTGAFLYVLIVIVGVDLTGLFLGLSVLVCSISTLALYSLILKGGQ